MLPEKRLLVNFMADTCEKIAAIDYNMSVWSAEDRIYGEDDIARCFDNMARCGVTTVYWRTSMVGSVTYRSRVQEPAYKVDWDEYLANTPAKARGQMTRHLAQAERMRYILGRYDPPAVAIRHARRLGLPIYLWMTCFDDYYPGHHGVFARDGVCLAGDRTGQRKMRGVLSYAWPEARRRRLSEVEELLGYGADGLYICTKSHTQHTEPAREADTYGFEAPVAAEFERRHGVDILAAKDFDREAWHSLKGEFFTQFIREVRALANARSQRLSLGVMMGRYHYFRAPALSDGHVLRFENQWRLWAREGLVDELVVGNGQRLWDHDPLWSQPGFDWPADTSQAGFLVDQAYPPAERHNVKTLLWSGWIPSLATPAARERIRVRIEAMGRACRTTSAEGMVIHEADAFEAANQYGMIAEA